MRSLKKQSGIAGTGFLAILILAFGPSLANKEAPTKCEVNQVKAANGNYTYSVVVDDHRGCTV